jgi:hypothetical protein
MSRGLTEAAKQAAKSTPPGYDTFFEYRRAWYSVTAFPDGKTFLVRREDRSFCGKVVL